MASSDLEQRLEEKVGSEKAAAYLEFEDFVALENAGVFAPRSDDCPTPAP